MIYGTGQETPADRDAYARLVMIQVTANFKRAGWFGSCRKLGIDADSAASDLASHVIQKTPRARSKMVHPCEKVVVGYVGRMIVNRMLSLIRHRNRTHASAKFLLNNAIDDDSVLDRVVAPSPPADLSRLGRFLRDREDETCRGIPGDIFAIVKTYRYLCRKLTRAGEFVPFDKLPDRLRDQVDEFVQYQPLMLAARRLALQAAADAV